MTTSSPPDTAPSPDPATMTTGQLVEAYYILEQRVEALASTIKDETNSCLLAMHNIKQLLGERLRETDESSKKTAFGTVMRYAKSSYKMVDASQFRHFLMESGSLEAATIAPSAEYMKGQVEQGLPLPPGIFSDTSYIISIRPPARSRGTPAA
jgi:hypothetical protein